MMKLQFIIIAGLLIFPSFSFATESRELCSKNGYTVVTINGIFTNDDAAKANKNALEFRLGPKYNGEGLKVDYLFNPSHLGGFGDTAKSLEQKIYDSSVVTDYDLVEMLTDASQKITTQKVLIVAHSQGNFYANSLYDTVAGQTGGVSKESIAVYSVATPSGRVAGGGKWLTSDTDKVIAGFVGQFPVGKIMKPNTHIEINPGDEFFGHDFSKIYLRYRGSEIVSDIQSSLNNLKSNNLKDTQKPCLDPPELSFFHKTEGVAFAIIDPVANAGRDGIVFSVGVAYEGSVFVVHVGSLAVGAVSSLGNIVANAVFGATVWTYQTGLYAVQVTTSTMTNVASAAYSAVRSLVNGNDNLAVSNVASVATALSVKPQPVVSQEKISPVENQVVKIGATSEVAPTIPTSPIVVSETEPSKPHEPPKIILTGLSSPGYGGGGGGGVGSRIIEKPTVSADPVEPIILPTQETSLSAPTLTASQCDFSLATDGCLVATTTINVAWSPVAGADFYQLNSGGILSTTTELSANILVPDFSDYIFQVSAISVATSSATTTLNVSVASIPIAINEVSWMGTQASTSDEWIELKNNTSHTLSLDNWEIQAQNSEPYIKLSGEIRPHEYLVLAQGRNNIFTDVLAYQVYVGEMRNSGEELVLLHASTTFDKTPELFNPSWIAGMDYTSTTLTTMERYSSKESGSDFSNWNSNSGLAKSGHDVDNNIINGTPGARNSLSYLINKGQNVENDLTLGTEENVYIVTNTVSVDPSATLTINPGVVIKFGRWSELDINGKLIVDGTPENNVIFESLTSDKEGEVVVAGRIGTSTITNATFSGIKDVYADGNTKLEIDKTSFLNNQYGVIVGGHGTVIIENSNFASTTYEALYVSGNASVTISSSTINNTIDSNSVGIYGGAKVSILDTSITNTLDGDAVGVYNSQLIMASSTIDGVADGDGVGAYDSDVSITNSLIENIVDGSGIGAYDSTITLASSTVNNIAGNDALGLYDSTSAISSSTIKNGEYDGVAIYGGEATISNSDISGFSNGAGVVISSPSETVVISNTEISGNETGVLSHPDNAVSINSDVSIHDNAEDVATY